MRLDRSFGIILKYPSTKNMFFLLLCYSCVFISICCSLAWRNVHEWDLLTSQLVWKSILIRYAAFTNVMHKLEISCAHTLKWTFQWGQRHLVSSSSTFELKRYIVYICIFNDQGTSRCEACWPHLLPSYSQQDVVKHIKWPLNLNTPDEQWNKVTLLWTMPSDEVSILGKQEDATI